MNDSYKAQSIQVLKGLESVRKTYDLDWLASQVSTRGSISTLSKSLSINDGTLRRAIEEAQILALFPGLSKSKSLPLSRLRTKNELLSFTKRYDVYKLEVRQIYRLVKEFRKEIDTNPRILLNSIQHDLIVGSVLGDASIRERETNCKFRVTHSKKQKDYLEWKYILLKEFVRTGIKWRKRIINGRQLETSQFDTNTHYVFNYYRRLFYENGKKTVTRKILNLLNPRSLAIWICDDGSYSRNHGYIVLCTNSFSLKEHKIMKKYFEEIWNLSPTIGFRDNKYYYLRFRVEDTKKLISMIKPFILETMRYKIGE